MAQLTTTATGHITVIDGQPTTTTQDIAEVYGKQHDNVLRVVRQRMAEAGEWGVLNFEETVTQRTNPSGGAPIQSPVIRMTKKGFHFVVGKFTGAKAVAHQIAFADEFERMEAALTTPAPAPTLANHAGVRPVDVRALLITGLTEPVPLPKDVEQAIDRQAWDISHQAHTLLIDHLRRTVAYKHVVAGKVNTPAALSAIRATTLGSALAHTARSELQTALSAVRVAAAIAADAQRRVADQLAALAAQE
jgi:Rha family phage regulatory protein